MNISSPCMYIVQKDDLSPALFCTWSPQLHFTSPAFFCSALVPTTPVQHSSAVAVPTTHLSKAAVLQFPIDPLPIGLFLMAHHPPSRFLRQLEGIRSHNAIMPKKHFRGLAYQITTHQPSHTIIHGGLMNDSTLHKASQQMQHASQALVEHMK